MFLNELPRYMYGNLGLNSISIVSPRFGEEFFEIPQYSPSKNEKRLRDVLFKKGSKIGSDTQIALDSESAYTLNINPIENQDTDGYNNSSSSLIFTYWDSQVNELKQEKFDFGKEPWKLIDQYGKEYTIKQFHKEIQSLIMENTIDLIKNNLALKGKVLNEENFQKPIIGSIPAEGDIGVKIYFSETSPTYLILASWSPESRCWKERVFDFMNHPLKFIEEMAMNILMRLFAMPSYK